MKKLLVLVILCCYHATSLYAQQTISLPNADAISFDCHGNNFDAYTKIGPNQYTRQSLQVEGQTKQDKSPDITLIEPKINPHKDTVSRKDFDELPKRFIVAKDLHAIDWDSYVGMSFTMNDSGENKSETDNSTYVLTFLRQDFAVIQPLIYRNGRGANNDCSLSNHTAGPVIANPSTRSEYFVPLILKLKEGKKVLLLYNRGVEYMMFPSSGGWQMFEFDKNLNPKEPTIAAKECNDAKSYNLRYFNKKTFYSVQKTETGKYRLFNILGQDVLKEEYDSINNGYRFTIAKRGNDIDVFNLYNKKLNIGKVKVVKMVDACVAGCIEVLNEEGAYYYDEMGNKLKHPIMGSISLCKMVSNWQHNILKKQGNYQMQIYTDEPGSPIEDECYWLSDLLPSDAVTFLDGDKSFFQSENSSLCGDIDVQPEWIRVGRKGKFGIIAYEYKQKKGVKPKLVTKRMDNYQQKVKVYPPVKVVGKTIFPINNDSIIMRPDGLIYFYKDKKVGLFPRDKTPVYDEIKKATGSFYHIVKNGISGWLDIKTDEEYWE